MAQDNSKRQLLRVATKVMGAIGVLGFVGLLLSSMFKPESDSKAVPSMLVDTAGIVPGQAVFKLWRGRPVLLYKRRPEDLQALQLARQRLLDPLSENSRQPEFATGAQRSLTPEWFVAFSTGTHQGCPIETVAPGDEFQNQAWLGGFADTCGGSRYDFAGRVFSDQKARKNLAIPQYSIKADGAILLGGS